MISPMISLILVIPSSSKPVQSILYRQEWNVLTSAALIIPKSGSCRFDGMSLGKGDIQRHPFGEFPLSRLSVVVGTMSLVDRSSESISKTAPWKTRMPSSSQPRGPLAHPSPFQRRKRYPTPQDSPVWPSGQAQHQTLQYIQIVREVLHSIIVV